MEHRGSTAGEAFHGLVPTGASCGDGRRVVGADRVPLAEGDHPTRTVEPEGFGNLACRGAKQQRPGERGIEAGFIGIAVANDAEESSRHAGSVVEGVQCQMPGLGMRWLHVRLASL